MWSQATPERARPASQDGAGERTRKNRREARKVPTPRQGFRWKFDRLPKVDCNVQGEIGCASVPRRKTRRRINAGMDLHLPNGGNALGRTPRKWRQIEDHATKPGGAASESADSHASGDRPANLVVSTRVEVDRQAARPQNQASGAQTYPPSKGWAGGQNRKNCRGTRGGPSSREWSWIGGNTKPLVSPEGLEPFRKRAENARGGKTDA